MKETNLQSELPVNRTFITHYQSLEIASNGYLDNSLFAELPLKEAGLWMIHTGHELNGKF